MFVTSVPIATYSAVWFLKTGATVEQRQVWLEFGLS
jgi:hypothetical protein